MANEVETRMGAMLTAIILGEDYPSELNMSRIENILQSIIDDTEYDDPIYSRIEFLLLELKKKMEENPTIEELTVTQNGTYQEEGKAYSPVNVNVEGGPVIAELRVTENGTYEESGKAYSPVIVDVDEGPTIESLSVTANGTYSEEGKAYTPVVVNIEGYKLEDMPTGAIATITDAAALPLNELKVAIEPVQSGSGDPSPSNVRPITGWTECNLTRTGKNLFNVNDIASVDTYGNSTMRNGVIVKNIQGNFIISGVQTDSSYVYARVKNGITYGNVIYLSQGAPTTISQTITLNENDELIIYDGSSVASMDSSKARLSIIQIEKGSTATTYEAYKGNTYNIEFPSQAGTVYGGTLDVTNGVLTVTDGYIASYNGENLPSTWISSMDVYAEGTTPTNSAEVVYKLATPQIYNVTPTEIKTLLGINNIFADTGDVLEGEYFKEL